MLHLLPVPAGCWSENDRHLPFAGLILRNAALILKSH